MVMWSGQAQGMILYQIQISDGEKYHIIYSAMSALLIGIPLTNVLPGRLNMEIV